jgi:hypothetical protein
MARVVDLTGMVPVTVKVDLDTEQVMEVHVWDEEVRVDKPLPDDDPAWPDANRHRRARRLAGLDLWPVKRHASIST